ncbi:MAG: hypothetical protein GX029_10730 [Pseudomonadaceae bacterium]|nr:hypothetical protein [Pseudomonadaceae bacterium]
MPKLLYRPKYRAANAGDFLTSSRSAPRWTALLYLTGSTPLPISSTAATYATAWLCQPFDGLPAPLPIQYLRQ